MPMADEGRREGGSGHTRSKSLHATETLQVIISYMMMMMMILVMMMIMIFKIRCLIMAMMMMMMMMMIRRRSMREATGGAKLNSSSPVLATLLG